MAHFYCGFNLPKEHAEPMLILTFPDSISISVNSSCTIRTQFYAVGDKNDN